MPRFVTQGLTYPEACKIKDACRAVGIEAGETSGGMALYPTDEQVKLMYQVCAQFNCTPMQGKTISEQLASGDLTEQELFDRYAP